MSFFKFLILFGNDSESIKIENDKVKDDNNSKMFEIKAEFDIGGLLLVKLYGNEKFYGYLAENLLGGHYYLQLKPYGHLFNTYYDKIIKEGKKVEVNEEDELLTKTEEIKVKQFHELNHDDVNDFPPYYHYRETSEKKFRR